jgi:hypothetical protein
VLKFHSKRKGGEVELVTFEKSWIGGYLKIAALKAKRVA